MGTSGKPSADRLPATPVDNSPRWLEWGFLAAALMASAIALTPTMADPDLWGHVQYGRDLIEEGLPSTTTYSYTAEGFRWINHENIAELVFAVGADTVGGAGMVWVKCLVGLAVLGLIVYRCRRFGLGIVTICLLALLVAVNLTFHWSMRPQLFTYTFFALMLVILSRAFRGWEFGWRLPWLRKLARADAPTAEGEPPAVAVSSDDFDARQLRWLWLAVPLFCVWTNAHGGFVAGWCIFAAILGLRSFEMLITRGRRAWPPIARMSIILFAAAAATFVNPYGLGLHGWMVSALGVPRPEISEWASLSFSSETIIPFAIMFGLWGTALCFSRRSLDFTHLVVMSLVVWQAFEHGRHVPFFALLFGFWMPLHVESLFVRIKQRATRDVKQATPAADPPMSWGSQAFFALALAGVYCLLGERLYSRAHEMPVQLDRYPVAAVQYLADRDVEGKLVVTFNWAQYAIMALGPQGDDPGLLVSLDGRFRTCYPQEAIDRHFDFVLGDGVPGTRYRSPNSPPVNPTAVLEEGAPDLVLLNRHQTHSVEVMQTQTADWVLLYQDELAQVWGTRDRFDNPASDDYIPPALRVVSDAPQKGTTPWPALPVEGGRPSHYADSAAADTARS